MKLFGKNKKKGPSGNNAVCIYGPPEMLAKKRFSPEQNEPVDIYGPPPEIPEEIFEFEDAPVPLYGPPEMLKKDDETDSEDN